jgi:hypothetical protein
MSGTFILPIVQDLDVDFDIPTTTNINDLVSMTASITTDRKSFWDLSSLGSFKNELVVNNQWSSLRNSTENPNQSTYYKPAILGNTNIPFGNTIDLDVLNWRFKESGTQSITLIQTDGARWGYRTKQIYVNDNITSWFAFSVYNSSVGLLSPVENIELQFFNSNYAGDNAWSSSMVGNNFLYRIKNNWSVAAVDDLERIYFNKDDSVYVFDRKDMNIFAIIDTPSGTGTILNSIDVDNEYNILILKSNRYIIKMDLNGNTLWTIDTNLTTFTTLCTDKDGNVYIGGNTATERIKKYDKDGLHLWDVDPGATVNSIATDSNNNLVVGHNRTSNLSVRQYDPDGVLNWSYDFGANTENITVDKDNDIWISRLSGGNLRKLSSSGALLLSRTGPNIHNIATDSNKNVLALTDISTAGLKYFHRYVGTTLDAVIGADTANWRQPDNNIVISYPPQKSQWF